MPSTYSPSLRFELIGTGEQAGTWGTTTNTNVGTLIEKAIAGAVTVSMTDADYALTANNGADDQSRNMMLLLTSGVSLTQTRTVTCPAVSKLYVVYNGTSGGQSITFTSGSGTTVAIPNGRTIAVYCDGTNIKPASDYSLLTYAGAGSVSAPSYTFAGRTSDGIYSPAANTVGVTVNGVEQLRATTSGVTLAGSYLSTQPSFRNKIMNGRFDFWQRGVSQTSSGYGSDDRWFNSHSGSTKVASRQTFTLGQTDVPGNPAYFSRTVVTSVANAANYVVKQQRLESVYTLAGQTVTLSFWAKADASKYISIDLSQYFGTGGSPSATVSAIGAQKFSLTTSWQKFTATISVPSISGKTLGSSGDCVELTFWFDAGSNYNARSASLGQQSGTFDIAMVQLEAGSAATPFEDRAGTVELALCQRYYCVGVTGGVAGSPVNSRYLGAAIPFPVTMRALPTVTIADLVGNAGAYSTGNGNNFTISAGATSAVSASTLLTDVLLNADPGNWWRATYAADAEL